VSNPVLRRELEHHEDLYSGFAQQHFAKPAVRLLRAHMIRRILSVTGAGQAARVLSLGCGIGDTELLMARHVGEVVGLDLSPKAIEQAAADAQRSGVRNVHFVRGALQDVVFDQGSFDFVIAVFFLHHLPDVSPAIARVRDCLRPGGRFYSLDPSRYRLTGAIGKIVVPHLMRKYQTPDERELRPADVLREFRAAGFEARTEMYDFLSSPLAGLFPAWGSGYSVARGLDELIVRLPGLRAVGSNFEIIARKPR
jgi:SAM-dependent methyltransferase